MTDIIYGERMKKMFRMMLKTGMRFLKAEIQVVDENLRLSQNPVIKNLNSIILMGVAHTDPGWQKKMMQAYGQMGLWLIIKDTAYRDSFFWMLDQWTEAAIKNPEKVRAMLKPYVKPPEEWTPNRWQSSKKLSNKLRREKKISRDQKSFEETIWTPTTQDARHKKLLKEK